MDKVTKINQNLFDNKEKLQPNSETSIKQIVLGIAKEDILQENRVSLTPLSVAVLVESGFQVLIESGAGEASNFLDHHYSDQGAFIVYEKAQVFQCDILLKIASPTLAEVSLMRKGQVIISSQQPSLMKINVLKAMMEKKITALSHEYLRDEGGFLSVVRAMSEIVGSTSILIAGEYLSNIHGGKGLMLGGVTGISSTEIVIIGAGTVGEYAARTAIALGAQVKVFDNSVFRLQRLQNNIGYRVFTSLMQPMILNNAIKSSDVVIGALRAKDGRSPCVVSEETVADMRANSVLIDVSIDQGGCFETSRLMSHDNPIFRKYNVIHYCVPNIASRVARTSTYALTNIFTPLLLQIGECGGIHNLIWKNSGLRNAVYLYQGKLTNKDFADRFDLPYKDLNLMVYFSQ